MNFIMLGCVVDCDLLIMKSLCVLAVVVVAVTASPDCSSYCDISYSGWKIAKRSDCNCDAPQKQLEDGLQYEDGLKSKLLSGFMNSKPNEVKHNTAKLTKQDKDIPLEEAHNSSITSKSADDELNDSQIKENDLKDCVDLLISISIRKNKNKSITNLQPNALKTHDISYHNDLEISTEIKSKCDEASAIMQQSVAEIKEHQKYISKKKNQNFDETPKIDTRTAFELTDKENDDRTFTNDDRSVNSIAKSTTFYDEPYTNDISTIYNTPKLDSDGNDYNLSTALEDNIHEETTYKNYNFKDLNYSVDVVTKDDNSTNLIGNTTSKKPHNNQTTTGNENSLSYTPNDLQKKNLTYELTSEKSLNPQTFPKSMLTNDYGYNVPESTSKPNQFITSSNKTLPTKSIDLIENNTFLRDGNNENEVPLIRIITEEYPNDTISSVINGTEILNYSEFEEDTINKYNKTKNTSDTRYLKNIESKSENQTKSDETPPSTSEKPKEFPTTSPTINGRLYFEYRQEHIPGKFVQTPDGRLQLSLDMNTICDKLRQKGKSNTFFISTLCQYYK